MERQQEPMVSSDVFLGLREAASDLGFSVDKELLAAGIEPRLLEDTEEFVSMAAVANVLAILAEKHACPELGFRVAEHRPKKRFGVITLLLYVSPDVGTALKYGHKYIGLATDSTRWDLSVESDKARITRTDRYPFATDLTQLHILSITQYIELMIAFMGSDWHPSAVYFQHKRPHDISYYKKVLRCPLYFGQEANAFVFPAQDLKTAIPTSDPVLLKAVLNHLESLAQEKESDDLCSRTRVFIRQNLGTRVCNLAGASSYLGLHQKSLQRELLANGLTFQEMLAKTRQDTATYYLEHSGIPLNQLASILGYSSLSSFSRAFTKRTGLSPKNWRLRNQKHL
jgi:AraC-like DNA-binding protein